MTHRALAPALALALLIPAPALAQDADPSTKTSPDAAIYLPHDAAVRETSLAALQETLLELATLRQNAHQAHWNVVGSDF